MTVCKPTGLSVQHTFQAECPPFHISLHNIYCTGKRYFVLCCSVVDSVGCLSHIVTTLTSLEHNYIGGDLRNVLQDLLFKQLSINTAEKCQDSNCLSMQKTEVIVYVSVTSILGR